jgi:nucleoside-diphosphate-sugar epimerase
MASMIVLTGITGFVGGALAAHLVARGELILALVRGDAADARAARSLERFGASGSTVRLISGDLASGATYANPLFDEATCVVHAAACTSFAATREAWRTNVRGTMLLAERMRRAPRLARFVHVGTAYACGDRPARVVREDDAPRTEQAHVNDYARTKAEAELRLAALSDLPLVVARPSAVIGHTSLGVLPSSSLFWYYRALAALGAGPFPRTARRDIVPVDYVALALAHLATTPRLAFRAYHVSAGERAVTMDAIIAAFAASALRSRATPCGVVHQAAWRTATPAELAESSDVRRLARTNEEARRLARGIAACARFGALGIDSFDNARLLAEGVPAPPRFSDYIARCIETSRGKAIYDQMVDDV